MNYFIRYLLGIKIVYFRLWFNFANWTSRHSFNHLYMENDQVYFYWIGAYQSCFPLMKPFWILIYFWGTWNLCWVYFDTHFIHFCRSKTHRRISHRNLVMMTWRKMCLVCLLLNESLLLKLYEFSMFFKFFM